MIYDSTNFCFRFLQWTKSSEGMFKGILSGKGSGEQCISNRLGPRMEEGPLILC